MDLNWFQRYGIPGIFFCCLSLAWFYAATSPEIEAEKLNTIIAGIALIFLPTGYVLTIFQQLLYLRKYQKRFSAQSTLFS